MKRVSACILLAIGAAAGAQDAKRPILSNFDIVSESQQIVLVNSGARGERVYRPGDVILDIPLLWESAARVTAPIIIKSGSDAMLIRPDMTLPETILSARGSAARIRGWCTPRIAAERTLDTPVLTALMGTNLERIRKDLRDANDEQTCLLDIDDDGIAEQSVKIHGGNKAARTPVAIVPMKIDRQKRVPLGPFDRLRIVLDGVSLSSRQISLRLDIIQQSENREFFKFGSTDKITSPSTPAEALPLALDIAGVNLDVLAVNQTAQTVTIRWPEDADREAAVTIPDKTEFVPGRPFYFPNPNTS